MVAASTVFNDHGSVAENMARLEEALAAGANVLVAASAVFNDHASVADNIARLRKSVAAGAK